MDRERVKWQTFEFRITRMDGTRIDTLLVRHTPAKKDEEEKKED